MPQQLLEIPGMLLVEDSIFELGAVGVERDQHLPAI
jgi:hypothetical protein